ncbi:MAG: NAD(P)/FAD-dependent oxidoreductase [Acidimicrobiia bacterium]|nr:NAD(P)/FAD-dependent oxidoreductase [Acidimicrobiia bacterium]
MSAATAFLVIGGGPAGGAAAAAAAAGGVGVTLVEAEVVGGASQLRDCIPSKALVASANGLAGIRASGHLGSTEPGPLRPDPARLAERRHSIASLLSESLRGRLESLGVILLAGRARFLGPHTAVVAGADGAEQEVEFAHALIAAGSVPRVPAWAEPDGERVLTSRQAYRLGEAPEHAVIVGAGATGVEFAHILSSLGSRVTVLASRGRVLPQADPEASAVLEEEFSERGVVVMRGARARGLRKSEGVIEVAAEDGRTAAGSHVLLAVGLQPAIAGLGLEAAGVEVCDGAVVVDARQQTSVPHISAAGDVTGGLMLSSVGAAAGTVVGRRVAGLPVEPVDSSRAAQAVYTEPEIAWVGLQEAEAAAIGRRVKVTRAPFAANPRALMAARPRGFVKLISDPTSGVLLGGLVVGRQATELVGIVALAVQAGLRRGILADTLLAYPSLAETLAAAAR